MSELLNTTSDSLEEDEISLFDLAIVLGEEKKTILSIAGVTAGLAIVMSLLMTPVYSAKTVIMPPQQQQSSAASALASLGALAGLAGAAGVKSSDEMYIAFMNSVSLQNAVISKFGLQERYKAKNLLEARNALVARLKIAPDKKSGLITIEAEDEVPEFAAKLANSYVEELHNMMGRLAVTDAQQRRVFYEQQIAKTQEELADAEARFSSAKEKSGMQVTMVIAEGGVRASAELRAQIASKEVQIQAMSRYATAQNPDVQRLGGELAAIRSQLAKIEHGSGSEVANSPTQQAAVKAYRDIKAREAMMGVLIAQYEAARVDEAKEGPLIQQVDVATAPELRARPKRALMVIVAGFAGLFAGVLFVFVRRAIRNAAENTETSNKMQKLKAVWVWKN